MFVSYALLIRPGDLLHPEGALPGGMARKSCWHPDEMARFLEIAARARFNILISGGTGSGKTTLLNAISRGIDPTQRIITIEDAVELAAAESDVGLGGGWAARRGSAPERLAGI